jgi:hypothetical protein
MPASQAAEQMWIETKKLSLFLDNKPTKGEKKKWKSVFWGVQYL